MSNRPVFAMFPRPARSQGFTLIELMVSVAIIAILAAVAIPNYTQYVTRSRITEATGSLAELRLKMEQYYQDNRKYNTTGTTCGVAMPTTGTFAYTCAGAAQTFTLTATSQINKGVGSASGHYVYTLTESNAKATTTFKAVAQSGKACWLLKGDEC